MTLDDIAELHERELRYAYCFAVMAVAPELIAIALAAQEEREVFGSRPRLRDALDALERKLGSSASSTHKPR